MLVAKNSERPFGHKDRTYKGRFVFDGSGIRDQDKDIALFQELSPSPATAQASKSADARGLFQAAPQQAVAKQARAQSELGWGRCLCAASKRSLAQGVVFPRLQGSCVLA